MTLSSAVGTTGRYLAGACCPVRFDCPVGKPHHAGALGVAVPLFDLQDYLPARRPCLQNDCHDDILGAER